MIAKHKIAHSQSGSAVISSLFLVAIVASLGAGLVQVSSVSTKKQISSIDTTRALYIAEAGLSEAFLAVAQGRSGQLAGPEEPAHFGDGFYWVESNDIGNDEVELKSTGLVGHGRFTLAMVLRRSVNEVGSLGMCGLNDVTIGEGAQIDTYNAEDKGGLAPSGPTKVRSNGDITVYGAEKGGPPTMIDGNIHPGPNGVADLDPGVVVTGTSVSSSRGITLPTFKLPTLGDSQGNLAFAKGERGITLTEDAAYDNMTVTTGNKLTLVGPVRVRAENLVVYLGAELLIDTSEGPVGIYTTNATIFEQGSVLSNIGEDPTQCSLFALTPERTEKSTVSMRGEGSFFGMVVAPNSLVDIPGNLRLAGSIVAESLNIGAKAHVSFTPELESNGFGVEMIPTIVAWQIVETPDTLLTRGGGTVDQKIRIHAIPTKPSATSQVESQLIMKYLSTSGDELAYEGSEAGIPWASIKHVYGVMWLNGGSYLNEVNPKVIIDAIDRKLGNATVISLRL